MRKLIPKSRLVCSGKIPGRVKRDAADGSRTRHREVLLQAQRCWDSLDKFRNERRRNKRYTYGDQWGDYINYKGERITEEEYIREQGGIPLKNNLIRRLVRTMVGVYRKQFKEPTCYANDRDEQGLGETMSMALQVNRKLNRMGEMGARCFEEFLISGTAVQKETFGWRNDRMDCWTDAVSPNHIFFDAAMSDIRHWDISMIGEIHDLTFEQVCSFFAASPEDYTYLCGIYSMASGGAGLYNYDREEYGDLKNIDFLSPYDTTLCRVVEVWCREQKPRYRCHDYLSGEYYKVDVADVNGIVKENAARVEEGIAAGMAEDDIPLIEMEWFMDDYWYYRFLTPYGDCLREGETPYKHKSHPYTIKLYPFIDGEIHSFVADVIDQQRYVNRLITTNDFVVKSSAKGVLMVPNDAIPDDKTVEEFAEEWSRPDGLIIYNPSRSGQIPQQVANKSTNVGMGELLQLQIKLMEEITGVNSALQGKPGFSGQSAALYQMQQQNANTALLDLLEAFSGFVIDGSVKKVKNIQQFYDSKRVLNIVGRSAVMEYDPDKVNDIEFDLNIVEGMETPVYRMIANDWLMKLWERNAISIEQLLQHGNFPFADELLQSIKADREAVAQGGVPQGVPKDIMEQVSANANPAQVAELERVMSNG